MDIYVKQWINHYSLTFLTAFSHNTPTTLETDVSYEGLSTYTCPRFIIGIPTYYLPI